MKLRDFTFGVVTGLAAAIVIQKTSYKIFSYLSPNEVLEHIKHEFKKDAPIDGSWIYMKVEPFTNGAIKIPVYRGGISRMVDGELQTFEFAANAASGVVVEQRNASRKINNTFTSFKGVA